MVEVQAQIPAILACCTTIPCFASPAATICTCFSYFVASLLHDFCRQVNRRGKATRNHGFQNRHHENQQTFLTKDSFSSRVHMLRKQITRGAWDYSPHVPKKFSWRRYRKEPKCSWSHLDPFRCINLEWKGVNNRTRVCFYTHQQPSSLATKAQTYQRQW